jgi:hypothetical protein
LSRMAHVGANPVRARRPVAPRSDARVRAVLQR